MCRGDAQLLLEGQIIPYCSMWSNSCLAMRKDSGARRRVRAATAGPVVWMWWVTVCLTGRSEKEAWVTSDGNLDKSWEYGSDGFTWWRARPLDEVFVQTTPWRGEWWSHWVRGYEDRPTIRNGTKISTKDSMWYICHYKYPAECTAKYYIQGEWTHFKGWYFRTIDSFQ